MVAMCWVFLGYDRWVGGLRFHRNQVGGREVGFLHYGNCSYKIMGFWCFWKLWVFVYLDL